MNNIQESTLTQIGISAPEAAKLTDEINSLTHLSPESFWQTVSTKILKPQHPFALHKLLYTTAYPEWKIHPAPAWLPTEDIKNNSNIYRSLNELKIKDYQQFHRWSVEHFSEFWEHVIRKLNISFIKPYSTLVDLKNGVESPHWLTDAKLNIVESCFNAPKNAIALIEQTENGKTSSITYGELEIQVNQIAASIAQHFKPGDALGICMPMTSTCVVLYLGIIKAGCSVVSIADSFSAEEIATRLRITAAKGIFTQDEILRANKRLALYERVVAAQAPTTIVIPCAEQITLKLRDTDHSWSDFLSHESNFTAHSCNPHDAINILFSSGTTGDPKAIPWDHTTAIKAAMDAHFHHDIHPNDVLAWPTNIGWMMGPWLIFASLLNQATIALFNGTPLSRSFGEFVQNTKVTMLGLVPSIVKAWRNSACMEGLDWHVIRCFSSSGESSNAEDMLYLMSLAGYRPIIEYCGGTEIGGGYITSTVVQPNAPATFTTPALGLDFVMIDEHGAPSTNGEVALIPPSMGLSTELLNKDHHQVYYAHMPKTPSGQVLRRHGDQIEKIDGYYRALGRVDDTMNLGGIKISSAEIERTLSSTPDILETAAIAVNPPEGGPSWLIIYAVPKISPTEKVHLKKSMQDAINKHLNPLFKIHDVVLIEALPRTASNKVMRRVLRDKYTILGNQP